MTTTEVATARESFSESVPELVAGFAVIVLTILGLAGVSPPFLVAVATIVFGLGLLLNGRSALSEIHRALARQTDSLARQSSSDEAVIAVNGWSTVFLAGRAGIVLGILALLGVASMHLVAIAVIAYGAALLISTNASMRMRVLLSTSANTNPILERLIRDTAADSAGLQTIAGLSAIVLGILALSGFVPITLLLIALLCLGCFIGLTSTFLAGSLVRTFQGSSLG